MKTTATLVLVGAGAIYLLTFVAGDKDSAALFVRAAAEAAMVGGLADWFAVTALFRRPLGLPIPHTALIPRKKDELAANLGTFVTDNFLTRESVYTHVTSMDLVGRVAGWLAVEPQAQSAAEVVAKGMADALKTLDPASVSTVVLEFADLSIVESSPSEAFGQALSVWVEGRGHDSLTELLLREGQKQGREHRDELADQLQKRIEDTGFISWLFITSNRSRSLIDGVVKELEDAERDRGHVLRKLIDGFLADVAAALATNTETAERVDASLREWLAKPEIREQAERFAAQLLDGLVQALSDPHSPTVKRMSELILRVGRTLGSDAALRRTVALRTAGMIADTVAQHSGQLTALIEKRVKGWNGKDASRVFELAAGKDLQYIRINGAVVGAIAGVAIHAVSLLL